MPEKEMFDIFNFITGAILAKSILFTNLVSLSMQTAPVVREENLTIEAEYWENGKNFWCYFCDVEASKHMKLSNATVKDGGIMEHLASTEHKEKTEIFWTLNKIAAEKKTQFIVSEEDFIRYLLIRKMAHLPKDDQKNSH
jgi:hypothetical protein